MAVKALVISNYRSPISSRPEAEFMIGLQQSGIDITIMTYSDAAYCEHFEKQGIRVIRYHPEKKRSAKAIKIIHEELVKGQYDILHLFNSKAIYNGIRAAKRLPVKVVLYRGYTGGIYWYDPLAYTKYLSPRVDKVTCLSESIKEMLQKTPFFSNEKAITINKGHNPEWYKDVFPADIKPLGIPENAFVISHVSNARKMKGIPYLLKATYLLPKGLPVYFLLVGNNMDTAKNKGLIKKSPYKDHIFLTGFRSDVLNIVRSSNIFILPSLFGEATTKALLEAMSLGIAPLATSIPGNRELVINGENAIVVPPGDEAAIAKGIMDYYNDPEKITLYGNAAKEHVQTKFHTRETVRKMKALYEELAKTSS
jgi:L-malate glycosyltransferase